MAARIHPTAIVHDGAEIGADVEIGPFAIVGENCRIGDGCVVAARATLERNVILGAGVKVGIGTVLGITSFEQAAFYSLVFVLINMPFVIVTGYIAWQERYKGAKTTIFGVKIGGTIVVCATLVAMVIWRLVEPGVAASPGRWTYLLICLVCVAGAGIAGHMGGKLVFSSRKP